MTENELRHHGILGQKWGVRRFQNPDGTLTAEGKRRYYNEDGSPTTSGRTAIANNKISIKDQREMQLKLHNSKEKKKNEFSNEDYLYSSNRVSKGKKYIKALKKQILNGYVTSFTENAKGDTNVKGKTSRGVVIRDKDGNRVTSYDYMEAQRLITKLGHRRIRTGQW